MSTAHRARAGRSSMRSSRARSWINGSGGTGRSSRYKEMDQENPYYRCVWNDVTSHLLPDEARANLRAAASSALNVASRDSLRLELFWERNSGAIRSRVVGRRTGSELGETTARRTLWRRAQPSGRVGHHGGAHSGQPRRVLGRAERIRHDAMVGCRNRRRVGRARPGLPHCTGWLGPTRRTDRRGRTYRRQSRRVLGAARRRGCQPTVGGGPHRVPAGVITARSISRRPGRPRRARRSPSWPACPITWTCSG